MNEQSRAGISGTSGSWLRNWNDEFFAADVDGDGRVEVVVTNPNA